MKGFYQVSDKVSANIITGVTSGCESDDCKLSARIGETTLMGTANYYDKDGILQVIDPNRFTVELCCCKCWNTWTVNEKGEILNKCEK